VNQRTKLRLNLRDMGLAFDLFTGGWSPRRDYVFFGARGAIVSLAFWYVLHRRTVPSLAAGCAQDLVGRE